MAFSEHLPVLGAKLKKKWTAQDPDAGELCLVHSAQMYPCVDLAFDGVRYWIGYDEHTKRVTYIYTDDEKFRTNAGLKVGDVIPVASKTLTVVPSVAVYAATTGDGWRPEVGHGLPGKVKLTDGTELDPMNKDDAKKSGMSKILAFSKGKY